LFIMGMERVITFTGATSPWEAIQREALAAGLSVAMRMIDGLPAFPDEAPEAGWRELRVSTGAGMITLRQQPGQLAIVVWGNADESLRQEWERLVQACARAVNGTLQGEPGSSCAH
jgi:hypothetical protein